MKTILPSASACLLVVLVASVSYAESRGDKPRSDKSSGDQAVTNIEDKEHDAQKEKLVQVMKKSQEEDGDSSSSVDSSPTLSVAPLDHEIFPHDRPTWIRQTPHFESDVHTWAVVTSGRDSIEDCEAEIEVLKRAAVALYIKQQTGWVCVDESLDDQWIESELVQKRYVGTLLRGDQQLNEIAIELAFDQEARARIEQQWKSSEVNERLRASGGLFAMVLVGLCCSGGLLSVISRRFG